MNDKETEQVEIIISPVGIQNIEEAHNEAPSAQKSMKKKYAQFPLWLAIIVLIINLVLPGIGTFIATARVTDRTYINFYCLSGLCQFLTFICIIGWVFALIHSITFISVACSHKSVEEYLASAEVQNKPMSKMSNRNIIEKLPNN